METTIGRPAWHVHHEVLVEVLTEPIEARREYIRRAKPVGVVVGPLPAALSRAEAARVKALSRAEAARVKALLALHTAECGCGWTPERGMDFGVPHAD